MSRYKVVIHGTGYWQTVPGRTGRVSFYALRWVEGQTAEEAQQHAVELVSRQARDRGFTSAPNQAATLDVDSLEEADEEEFLPENSAFVFYESGESDSAT
jgi:hypothetical protein